MSSEVFDLIKFFWKHYNGKGFYLYLFLGCMVLLLFLRERRKYNRYLFWYCIGGLILYWIPYTAKIITGLCNWKDGLLENVLAASDYVCDCLFCCIVYLTVKEQTFCSGTGSADAVRTCL